MQPINVSTVKPEYACTCGATDDLEPYTPFGYTCTVWLCPKCVVDDTRVKKAFAIGDHVRIHDTYIHGLVCVVNPGIGVGVMLSDGDVIPVTRPGPSPEKPRGKRTFNTAWHVYDLETDRWLQNARAWCDHHDDDEIEQHIMCVECGEHSPYA